MIVIDGIVESERKIVQSKEVEERKDELRLSRTKTDPTCNLQTWQCHKHLLSLQHTAISLQTLSLEHGKLKSVGQEFLGFLSLCIFFSLPIPTFSSHLHFFSFSQQEDQAALKRRNCIISAAGRDCDATLHSPSCIHCS